MLSLLTQINWLAVAVAGPLFMPNNGQGYGSSMVQHSSSSKLS
jgi:hypothetical protein